MRFAGPERGDITEFGADIRPTILLQCGRTPLLKHEGTDDEQFSLTMQPQTAPEDNAHRIDFTPQQTHSLAMMMIHATCVSLNGHGVLLRGPSGSGKSDLALRLIDDGAILVGDDYCAYRTVSGPEGPRLIASTRPELPGALEVRGLGLIRLPHLGEAPVTLLCDLCPGQTPERMPTPETVDLCGVAIPRLMLDPFHASATAKIRLAVRLLTTPDLPERLS